MSNIVPNCVTFHQFNSELYHPCLSCDIIPAKITTYLWTSHAHVSYPIHVTLGVVWLVVWLESLYFCQVMLYGSRGKVFLKGSRFIYCANRDFLLLQHVLTVWCCRLCAAHHINTCETHTHYTVTLLFLLNWSVLGLFLLRSNIFCLFVAGSGDVERWFFFFVPSIFSFCDPFHRVCP